MKYRRLLKLLVGFIGTFVLMIVGVIFGSFWGGNFGFVEFGGNRGYEAGGVFGAILGMVFGGFLGVEIIKYFLKENLQILKGLVLCLILILAELVFFDRDINNLFYLYLFSPTFIFTFVLK